jgi:threonyl-tRNA synthetase
VGDKEKETRTVSIRIFGAQNNISMPIEEFISKITNKVNKKDLD